MNLQCYWIYCSVICAKKEVISPIVVTSHRKFGKLWTVWSLTNYSVGSNSEKKGFEWWISWARFKWDYQEKVSVFVGGGGVLSFFPLCVQCLGVVLFFSIRQALYTLTSWINVSSTAVWSISIGDACIIASPHSLSTFGFSLTYWPIYFTTETPKHNTETDQKPWHM